MNHKPTGPFPIMVDGIPNVGERLTARTRSIKDKDGIDRSTEQFQWLVTDTADGKHVTLEVPGETRVDYIVRDEDRGKMVSVRWSYTDMAGADEVLISEPMDSFAMDDAMENLVGLYRLSLEREPDGPGLRFWSEHYKALVDAGHATWEAVEAVVAAFSESDDFAMERGL